MSAPHDTASRAPVPLFIWELVCEANANQMLARAAKARGVPPKDSLADLFATADVVVLIYPDDDEPCGIGSAIPKGRALFDLSMSGHFVDGLLIPLTVASKLHAWAIDQVFGEPTQ